MSHEVILIVPPSNEFEKTEYLNKFEIDKNGCWNYSSNGLFININYSDLDFLYSEKQHQFLFRYFSEKTPKFAVVDTNNFLLLKELIEAMSSKGGILIDNDHGALLKNESFKEFSSFSELMNTQKSIVNWD